MRKIQGMGMLRVLFMIFGVLVLTVVSMKVVPVYIEHYEVNQAVKGLSNLPTDKFTHSMELNARAIKLQLINQFYINSIDAIGKDDIIIKPISYKQFRIIIKYQVRKKLFANISILLDFNVDKEVDINAP